MVPPKLNFSERLRTAFRSLKADPNIIIAKADKGDTVVVLNSERYYGLASKHLQCSRLSNLQAFGD